MAAAVHMATLTVPSRSALKSIRSSSTLSTKDLSLELAGKPELERVIAIHDYHDLDPRAFSISIGDEISVREKIQAGSIWVDNEYKGVNTWWLGVNVSTNTLGIFPPSHVRNLETHQEILQKDAEVENNSIDTEPIEVLVPMLKEHFYQQYPPGTDPVTTFNVVKWLKDLPAKEFWTPFFLAYPQASPSGLKLQEQLQSLYPSFRYRYTSNKEIDLRDCKSGNGWDFSETRFYPDENLQWNAWNRAKKEISRSVTLVADNWAKFRVYVVELESEIPAFSGMVGRLDGLVESLEEQLVLMEARVSDSLQQDAIHVREIERSRWAPEIGLSISKTNSWSSGVGRPTTTSGRMKSRLFNKGSKKASKNSETITSMYHYDSSNVRNSSKPLFKDKWRSTTNFMGQNVAVLTTVTLLLLASVATTTIATYTCTAPSSIPTIDSNFYSTLSSAAVGIASLYCTIIPILLGQEIRVDHQITFRLLLVVSLVMAVVSTVVYPYQTRASLVLMAVSTYAQLATTLQLILGAVSNIRVQNDRIEVLEERLAR